MYSCLLRRTESTGFLFTSSSVLAAQSPTIALISMSEKGFFPVSFLVDMPQEPIIKWVKIGAFSRPLKFTPSTVESVIKLNVEKGQNTVGAVTRSFVLLKPLTFTKLKTFSNWAEYRSSFTLTGRLSSSNQWAGRIFHRHFPASTWLFSPPCWFPYSYKWGFSTLQHIEFRWLSRNVKG